MARKKYSAEFKVSVVLEVLKDEKSLNIVPFWVAYMLSNKYKNSKLQILTILWGVVSGGLFFILS